MQVMRRKVVTMLGAAIVLAGGGVLLFRALSPNYVVLHTYLDDASGLVDGTQVRLNGIPIGYLDGQKFTNSRDPARKVEFDLKVRQKYLPDIPVDSRVGLASDNLLGDLYIGIQQGTSPKSAQPGDELPAVQAQDITRMMAQMSRQLEHMQGVATRAQKLTESIGKGKGNIGKIVQNPSAASGISGELDQLTAAIQHGNGTITKLMYDDPLSAQLASPKERLAAIGKSFDATSEKLKDFQKDVDAVTAEFKTVQTEIKSGNGSIAKVDKLRSDFDQLSAKVDRMMENANRGGGSLGQFMVNPQLKNAIDGTTRDFQALAKGLKANPRKFIAIRIF